MADRWQAFEGCSKQGTNDQITPRGGKQVQKYIFQ